MERCSAEHPIVEGWVFRDTAGMFLRRKNKSSRGVGYSYWSLCETHRTARGPRQRVVASLGKLGEAEAAGLPGDEGADLRVMAMQRLGVEPPAAG